MKLTDIIPKEDQLKDYQEVISKWADSNCKLCYARGYQGFDQNEGKYIPCPCVVGNLHNAQAKENQEKETEGVIHKIRNKFSLN